MDESVAGIVSVPPKLDLLSDEFDAKLFFSCPYDEMIELLPYPYVKPYNNLAEYYSHNFLKKDTLQRKEKQRYYERPYSWYYACMGWDQKTIRRYEYRQQRRPKKYMGWRTAKMRKYKISTEDNPEREPCRGFPPLKSSKIIQLDTPFRRRKIIPLNVEDNLNKNSTVVEHEDLNDVSNKTEIDLESDPNSFIDLMNKSRSSKREDNSDKNSTTEKNDMNSKVETRLDDHSLTDHMIKIRTLNTKNADFNRNSAIRKSEVKNKVSKHIEPEAKNLTEQINDMRTSKRKFENINKKSTTGKHEAMNKAENYDECDSNSSMNRKKTFEKNNKNKVLRKQIEFDSNSSTTASKISKLNLETFPSDLKPNCFQKRFLRTVQ